MIKKILFIIIALINAFFMFITLAALTSYGNTFPWSDPSQLCIEMGIQYLYYLIIPIWFTVCLIHTLLLKKYRHKWTLGLIWINPLVSYIFCLWYLKLGYSSFILPSAIVASFIMFGIIVITLLKDLKYKII